MLKTFKFFTSQSIVFGFGALDRLGDELAGFGAKKVLLVADSMLEKLGIAGKVKEAAEEKGIEIGLFTKIEPNPSIELAEEAAELVRSEKYEAVIGLGGGSSMDVGKIAAMLATNPGGPRDYIGVEQVKRFGIPTVMIPTTAGTGSEVTNAAILADHEKNMKFGTMSRFLTPTMCLVDPDLLVTLPSKVTASTGLDALTHSVEAYTGLAAYPMTDLFALESIRLIGKYLRRAVANGKDLEARYNMSLAAMYGGIAIATATVGAAHALAYPIEGIFGTAHGDTNGLMLPYVVEFNSLGNIPKFAKVAEAMGEKVDHLPEREGALKASEAIKKLCEDIEVPLHLSEIGVSEDHIDDLAEKAFSIKRICNNNPRELTLEKVKEIYRKAL